MKRIFVALTISFLCGINLAHATSDDLFVSVGSLSWYNRLVPISRFNGVDAPNSTWGLMTGPTLKARYKDLYLGVSYLLSANDYHLANSLIPFGDNQTAVTSSASRSDVDVVIGYLLTPRIDLKLGYRGIFIDDALTLAAAGGTYNARRNETYNLGTLGVGVTVPAGMKTVFLLNGNALLGDFENELAYPGGVEFFNDSDKHFVAWGVDADTGFSYAIIDHLSAGVGLRFQYIKAGGDNSSFFGPTARIDYRF